MQFWDISSARMFFCQNLGKTNPYNPLILGNRLQPTKNASKSHAVSIALMVTTVALIVNSCKWQNIWNAACHRPSLAKLEMKALQPFLKFSWLWFGFCLKHQIPQKTTNSLKKKPGPPMKVLSAIIFAPKIFRSQTSETFLPIRKKCKLHRTSTSIKTCCVIQKLSSNLPFLSFNGQSKGPLGGSSQELLGS